MRKNVNEIKKISESVIRRLPRYRRYLGKLKEEGVQKISSGELSKIMGSTAPQIRQDFNQFGGFGQQGYGYNVDMLYNEISNILKLNNRHKVAIIGIGNIGQAIAKHLKLNKEIFEVVALFDISHEKIGKTVENLEVKNCEDLTAFVNDNAIDIAVICVPENASQREAERIEKAGIKAILNFSPTDIIVSSSVTVENVRINESLYYLLYYIGEDD